MTNHKKLKAWVQEWAECCQPDHVYWCNGSEEESQRLLDEMVSSGAAVRLDESKRPGSYAFNSDPSDVARVEDRTFISTEKEEDAGPSNNWMSPAELKATMRDLYRGSMRGDRKSVV